MRSKQAPKRKVQPEPLFNDPMVAKVINRSMYDGKKTVAAKQVYKALEILGEKTKLPSIEVFNQALENIRPQMEVRPRRIGGAAYQVPVPVRGARRDSLAVRWLINAARSRDSVNSHSYSEKLAAEIIDAAASTGGAIKKKLDMHRMAEANKAFAHFRW